MKSSFVGNYVVDDESTGKIVFWEFSIDSSDIEDDMDRCDLKNLFAEKMEKHFRKELLFHALNTDEFCKWAQQVIREREMEKKCQKRFFIAENLTLEDLSQIIKRINLELYEKLKSDELCVELETNGFVCCVNFLGVQLWNTEDDERFRDENGDYEDMEKYLRNKIKRVFIDLQKYFCACEEK